jgi:hypothetical protein
VMEGRKEDEEKKRMARIRERDEENEKTRL